MAESKYEFFDITQSLSRPELYPALAEGKVYIHLRPPEDVNALWEAWSSTAPDLFDEAREGRKTTLGQVLNMRIWWDVEGEHWL